jgi:hypothetical protein
LIVWQPHWRHLANLHLHSLDVLSLKPTRQPLEAKFYFGRHDGSRYKACNFTLSRTLNCFTKNWSPWNT